MYRRFTIVYMILLLSLNVQGCKLEGEDKINETNLQYDTQEINLMLEENEGLQTYNLLLQDIFNDQIRNLSENIYFYEDKLYIDYLGETYVRLVFGRQGEEIVLLDKFELPSTWNRKSVGMNHYIISGDENRQILWIYDLNTGNMERFQLGENQTISCWDVKNERIYLAVKVQKTDEEIMNKILICGLTDGSTDEIVLERQLKRIYQMSVNDKGEIGIIYVNADSDKEHLGMIREGQFTEIDTSDVEVWKYGNNQFYEFKLLDDKFLICAEDIGHTLIPWNRTYEVYIHGLWKDIPCEWEEDNLLGYVDEFYYVKDYYLVYWSPWTMSGGYGADSMKNAKVLLCTLEGKCCKELDIPESNLLQTSVYFVYSDDTVYVISISGEDCKMGVQNVLVP